MALNWSDIGGMAIAGGTVTTASMWFVNALIDRKIAKLNGMFRRTDLCKVEMAKIDADIGLARHDINNVKTILGGVVELSECKCDKCIQRRKLLSSL